MRPTASWLFAMGIAFVMWGAWVSAQTEKSSEELVEKARKLNEEIWEKARIRLGTLESEHFLIHTSAPPAEAKKALKTAEVVYARFAKVFNIPATSKVWDGKYVIVLVKDQQQLADFWWKFKKGLTDPGFVQEMEFAPGVRGYATYPKAGRWPDQTCFLCWYMAGTFLNAYKGGKPAPPWLLLGFKDHCSNLLVGAKAYRSAAKDGLKKCGAKAFSVLREPGKDSPIIDDERRGMCFSLIEYMISLGPKKFPAFVEQLKEGVTEEEAIAQVFEMPPTEFQKGWFAFVLKKY